MFIVKPSCSIFHVAWNKCTLSNLLDVSFLCPQVLVMLGWGKHVAACRWWVVIEEFHWLSHRWEASYAHICHMANNEHKEWESFLLWIFISEKNLKGASFWEQIPIEISVWSLCSFVLKYFLAACESRGLVIRSKWPKWMSKNVKFSPRCESFGLGLDCAFDNVQSTFVHPWNLPPLYRVAKVLKCLQVTIYKIWKHSSLLNVLMLVHIYWFFTFFLPPCLGPRASLAGRACY